MKGMLRFPWQMAVQTSEVLPDLLDEWDIPPEGKVYACANVRWQCGDFDGDAAVEVIDGFMWVHLAGSRDRISIQKGFETLEDAETSAKDRARLCGAIYAPSIEEGDNDV
jgi:hypothetical protein